MLKSLLMPVCITAISATAFGQSTLTGATFNPVIGDAFAIKVCNTTGVAPGASGAGITWNFSSLVPSSADTGRAISCFSLPSSAPPCTNYPGTTIVIKGPSIAKSTTAYLVANATKLSQNGYFIHADTSLKLTNPADQLRYPFTYGTTFLDTCEGTFRAGPTTAYEAHHIGYINVNCDGHGTLNLPGSVTHTGVLRVHTTQNFTDSLNLFGTPLLKSYVISSYDWYKPNYHTALLTIQKITEVGNTVPDYEFIAYAVAPVTAVSDVDNKIDELQLYPNPASDLLNISYTTKGSEKVTVGLYDLMGREVAEIATKQGKGQQQIQFNTASYPEGVYIVRLQTGSEIITKNITLQ